MLLPFQPVPCISYQGGIRLFIIQAVAVDILSIVCNNIGITITSNTASVINIAS